MRFYGLDLRTELGRSSVRRLVALIRSLPEGSALSRVQVSDSSDEPQRITSGAAFAEWLNTNAPNA